MTTRYAPALALLALLAAGCQKEAVPPTAAKNAGGPAPAAPAGGWV